MAVDTYVASLAALGLPRLQEEPARLAAEASSVEAAIAEVSLTNYEVFIENYHCVEHAKAQVASITGRANSLGIALAQLRAVCGDFKADAAALISAHRRNRQTLQHHMQLLELLELPQLMDACVRNSLCEEALELASLANVLERRHAWAELKRAGCEGVDDGQSGGGAVVDAIVMEVRASASQLREKLLAQLRAPLALPACLSAVSWLRRLDSLQLEAFQEQRRRHQQLQSATPTKATEGQTESSEQLTAALEVKLMVEFLEARDMWLCSTIAEVEGRSAASAAIGLAAAVAAGSGDASAAAVLSAVDGRYQRLMDVLEKERTGWFEIATQFRAIFAVPLGGESSDTSGPDTGSDAGLGAAQGILGAWLGGRIDALIARLRLDLPRLGDGARLRSALEQCMFFGAGMGRIGADFRALLPPVFIEAVMEMAETHWTVSASELEVTLLAHQRPTNSRAAHAPSLRVAERLDRLDSAEDEEEESLPTVDATPSAAASPTPPKGLLRYPALARFLNCHLAALNQLRMCAPLDARPILHAALRGHVQRAARALSAYRVYEGEQRLANGTAATQSAADDLSSSGDIHATLGETLCGEFASTLVPHLCACFGAIFDSADGGILSAELRADLAAIGIFEVPSTPGLDTSFEAHTTSIVEANQA